MQFFWCYHDNIIHLNHLLACILAHKELWLSRLIEIISVRSRGDFWKTHTVHEKDVLQRHLMTSHQIHIIKLIGIIDFSGTWYLLVLRYFSSTIHPFLPLFSLKLTDFTSPGTVKKLEKCSTGIVAFTMISVLMLYCVFNEVTHWKTWININSWLLSQMSQISTGYKTL